MLPPRERVTQALDYLSAGLGPYVEERLKRIHKNNWQHAVRNSFRTDRSHAPGATIQWDAHTLLTVMWDQWNSVFRHELGHLERSMVSELREFRNRWAHQEDFSFYDAFRVLDSTERLLNAVDASEVESVRRGKRELLHGEFSQQRKQAAERTRTHRERTFKMVVYSVCLTAVLLVVLTVMDSPPLKWLFASALVLGFLYLCKLEFRETPVLNGPHECFQCRRIIYSEVCPYC